MARRPAVTGSTPEERREKREERSRANRMNFTFERLRSAGNGREVLVVAANAVLAAGKDMTEEGRRKLAAAVLEAVQTVDVPENRKAKR